MRHRGLLLPLIALLVLLAFGLLALVYACRGSHTWVDVGNLSSLRPGEPLDWQARIWVVKDGFGVLHAFPEQYDTGRGARPVQWLPAGDSLADLWLGRDACAARAGHGIFNVLSPANSRYDASGRRLFGPDRHPLDWYSVSEDRSGEIRVGTSKVHRGPAAPDAGTATPPPATAVPGKAIPANCARAG